MCGFGECGVYGWYTWSSVVSSADDVLEMSVVRGIGAPSVLLHLIDIGFIPCICMWKISQIDLLACGYRT